MVEAGVALEGYDLVMLGVLAAAALLGYFKGFLWQLAWIAGIAASTFVSFRFASAMAPFFGTQAPWNRYVAMLALYAGTSIAVWLVFRVISNAVNAVHLSAFDHQLGLLLGLAKGLLLCVVITFFSVTLAPAYRDKIVASKSGRLVAEVIVRADTYLPKDVHDTVDPFVKQFEQHFQIPPGMPAAAAGQSPTLAGQPSPLKAMWEGVTSAAAWTGAEQGGAAGLGAATQAGGALPAGSAWFVPRATGPASGSAPQPYNPLPAAGPASGFSAPQRFAPQPAASQPMPPSAFAPQPISTQAFAPQPTAPQRYPVGTQSPLQPR